MLPSMPSLMTPCKEMEEESSDSSDDSPPIHCRDQNGHGYKESSEESGREKFNYLPDFLNEATTLQGNDQINDKISTPEKRSLVEPTSAQKKKKKTQHKKLLAALTPESESSLEMSSQNFAEAYYRKVRGSLDEIKWAEFIQALSDFEESQDKRPADLYRKMEVVLDPHTELIDEFLAFLLPHEALEVNRFMPYLMLVKMREFFRKMNILLMKRQVRQVHNALDALCYKPDVTLADVKDAVLPLLKHSSILTNYFLELLPGERPPESLMVDFEQMDFKDDSQFETITVPDCPDPYGNENCICSCHTTQKNKHCISCGIKYLNGRVYLQHGKVLRPAKVSFNGDEHLDLKKWKEDKFSSRRRFLAKSMLSPTFFDHRQNADSEDDCAVKKSPRTPRIRVARRKRSKKELNLNFLKDETEALDGIYPLAETKDLNEDLIEDGEIKNNNEEHEFEDIILDHECNTEEDEEDDLNRHSENESSLEGEDIAKDLESGMDYSFEDEDVDDIENIEEVHNEVVKVNSGDSRGSQEDKTEKPSNGREVTKPVSHEEKTNQLKEEIQENLPEGSKSDLTGIKLVQNENESLTETNIKIEESVLKVEDIKSEPMTPAMDTAEGDDKVCNSVENTSREWTREEDKIILQTFQHESGLEQTFETASLQLPNRSKQEIQERFEILLKLLKEMMTDESNSS